LLSWIVISGNYAEADEGAVKLLELAEGLQHRKPRVRAAILLARIYFARGDWAGAVRQYELAAELCIGEELALDRSDALNGAATAWLVGGDLARARALYQEALVLAQRNGDHCRVALYQANLAESDWNDGDLVSARKRGEAALEAIRKSGDQWVLSFGLATLTQVLSETGDSLLACRQAEIAWVIAGETASPQDEVSALQARGQLYLGGRVEAPDDVRLEAAARKSGQDDFMITSLAIAARIALRLGALQRAEALALEILESTRDKNPSDRALARSLLAGLKGDEPGARDAIRAADATKSVPAAFYARLTAAEALLAARQPADALNILEELESLARDKGFHGTLGQTRMLCGKAREMGHE
jgi:tetratricopeptide (TPR) repeat protein